MTRRALALTLVAALSLAACQRPATPEDQYRRFAAAARAGESEEVFGLLAARSRRALEERARATAQGTQPGIVAPLRERLAGGLSAAAPQLAKVTLVRASREAATLSVEEVGGRTAEVELVLEEGAWRVVVPGI